MGQSKELHECPLLQEVDVPASVLYMSMSLDGYIAGPGDEPGHPGGDGFGRLHEWYGDFSRPSGPTGELHDELEATGASPHRHTAMRPAPMPPGRTFVPVARSSTGPA